MGWWKQRYVTSVGGGHHAGSLLSAVAVYTTQYTFPHVCNVIRCREVACDVLCREVTCDVLCREVTCDVLCREVACDGCVCVCVCVVCMCTCWCV